ncbi:MAG: hypothetical protein NVS2B4_22390 [Ramlibacter sp.]
MSSSTFGDSSFGHDRMAGATTWRTIAPQEPSMLANTAFWICGLASIGIWTGLFLLIRQLTAS